MTRWSSTDVSKLTAKARRVTLLGREEPGPKPKKQPRSFLTPAKADLEAARQRSAERRTVAYREGARKRSVQRHGTPGPRLRLPEAAVLRACMDLLEAHPKVAIWWRVNSGAVKIGERYIKFAFRGASDLMGVMAGSGKFLVVECKSSNKVASEDQAAFLANVALAGGYALLVDDPAYLAAWLERI